MVRASRVTPEKKGAKLVALRSVTLMPDRLHLFDPVSAHNLEARS